MDSATLQREIESDLAGARRRYQKVELPPQIMRELAAVPDSLPVRLFLASHPSTPGRIVERLFQEADPEILPVLACHPRLPGAMVMDLLQHDDVAVRLALAGARIMNNSSWSVVLCRDPDWRVRQRLAANPAIGPRAQAFLSDDPLALVRASLLKHPRIDEEILGVLCDDSDLFVRLQAAGLPKLPMTLLRHLAENGEELVQLAIVRRKQLPPAVLEILSRSPHDSVRRELMKAHELGEEELLQFAKEGDEALHLTLAVRDRLPLSVQRLLSQDASLAVRCELCRNSCLDDGVGVFMAVGDNRSILEALAENHGRLPNVWTILLDKKDDTLRKLMLTNENLPEKIVAQIAAEGDEVMQYHLRYRRMNVG